VHGTRGMTPDPTQPGDPETPSFEQALRVWVKIGLLSFGGPAGQIALMHRELVEGRRWISDARFLHALNYCMLLPGPEAQQLTVYIGWLMHRKRGGLVAGTLFVLPGLVTILALSIIYALFGKVGWVEAIFFGIKPAVLAIVLEALVRIGKRALGHPARVALAGLAFVAIFFFDLPFPLIIAVAAITGAIGSRRFPAAFGGAGAKASGAEDERAVIDRLLAEGALEHTRPNVGRAARVLVVCLALWWAPVAIAAAIFGSGHVLVTEGLFFSKTAVVTFGGAYAVLAYLGQQAVEVYGWLSATEMLDGLGLAETTPGPLIMVTQFVGFMGAYRQGAPLSPLAAGVLGSFMTTWVTFVPCFLWIFLGAPWVEALRKKPELRGALSAITASVVGVILNLSVWFALHVIFGRVTEEHFALVRLWVPDPTTVAWLPLVVSIAASIAALRFKVGMVALLSVSAAIGIAARLAGL
jgi:chromate transporter